MQTMRLGRYPLDGKVILINNNIKKWKKTYIAALVDIGCG